MRNALGRCGPSALRALALGVSLTSAGCLLDLGGPAPVHVGSFEPGAEMVAGAAGRVATWTSSSAGTRMTLYHQDAADPAVLLQDAVLPDCGCTGLDLVVNEGWAVAAGERAASYAPVVLVGVVQLARSGDAAAGSWLLDQPGWSRTDHATAWGDRLVAASGSAIRVYDLSDPAAPVLLLERPGTSLVTAVVASGTGAFAFTESGYVHVDLATGTFTAVVDPALAGVRHASAEGGKLHVGGTSRVAGCFRVARLDPSAAPALAIEADDDRIPDAGAADGEVIEMAYDAARGEYLVLKATTPRPSDLQSGTTPILRLGDGPAIGEPVRRQLDRPAVTSDSMTSTTPLVRAHAHGGLLYAILIPGTVNLPIDVYRMP